MNENDVQSAVETSGHEGQISNENHIFRQQFKTGSKLSQIDLSNVQL